MAAPLGIAFTTERITAEAHGLNFVTAVRYAPGVADPGDEARTYDWQPIDWYGDAGDVVFVGRSPEQAVVEIEGH